MGGANGAGLRRRSVVVIEADTGSYIVKQSIELEHDAGAPEHALMAQGLNFVRQMGGLTIDGEGGSVVFYPLGQLKKLVFSTSQVVLANRVQ